MASNFFYRFNVAITRLEQTIAIILGRRSPTDAYALAALQGFDSRNSTSQVKSFSLKDIIGNGILFAVPKSRRTIEKRLKRKYGHPDYKMKILLPKTHIRICDTCGDNYELGCLCPTCYKKTIDETKQMQDKIQEELKLEPVKTEVVVLYEGENNDKPTEFWEGKRIVEMKKARPSWFSKNLLQETTQQPATTTDIKPKNLS